MKLYYQSNHTETEHLLHYQDEVIMGECLMIASLLCNRKRAKQPIRAGGLQWVTVERGWQILICGPNPWATSGVTGPARIPKAQTTGHAVHWVRVGVCVCGLVPAVAVALSVFVHVCLSALCVYQIKEQMLFLLHIINIHTGGLVAAACTDQYAMPCHAMPRSLSVSPAAANSTCSKWHPEGAEIDNLSKSIELLKLPAWHPGLFQCISGP